MIRRAQNISQCRNLIASSQVVKYFYDSDIDSLLLTIKAECEETVTMTKTREHST